MRATILFVSLALAGCVGNTGENIYGGLFGQDVVGNSEYVTVSNVWNEMDALPIADKHCAKYGKVAKFNAFGGHRAIFDCVRPT